MFGDIKQTMKHTIVYGIGNFASKLVGFILIPLYTDQTFFSTADYGMLSLLDVTSQILIAAMGLAFYAGLVRWYWDKEYAERQKSLFFTIMVMTTIAAVGMGMIVWGFQDSVEALLLAGEEMASFDQLPYVFHLLLVYSVLSAIVAPVLDLLRLKSRSVQFSVVNILKLAVTLGVTVYFVVGLKRGIAGVYEAQVIGIISQLLLLLPFIIKNSSFKLEFAAIKQILSYSYPLMFPAIVGGLLTAFDKYMLNYMKGVDDVAFYAFGYKIGNTLKIFIVASVQLALTPLMMKKINDPNNRRFYSKIFTYLSFGGMYCVLGLSLLSREVIALVASNPAYYVSVYVVPFITFGIFFGMLRDTSVIGLQITKRTKIISSSIILITFINLGLNLLLIPVLGMYGAALATLIAQILSWIIPYYFAQKAYPIPYELGKLGKVIVVGICIYLLGMLTMPLNIWIAFVIKIGLLIAYPFILFAWKFYDDVELQRITGMWDSWKLMFSYYWASLRSMPRQTINLGKTPLAIRLAKEFKKRKAKFLYLIPHKAIAIALLEKDKYRNDFATYYETVKGKNSVKYFHQQACKKGAEFRVIDPALFEDDIFEVNTSLETRQGKDIKQEYLQRGNITRGEGMEVYGVFIEDKLVGYIRTLHLGDTIFINNILGHGAYLKAGIMYFLLLEVLQVYFDRNDLKYIIYDSYWGNSRGLALFKKRFHFEPTKVKWINR